MGLATIVTLVGVGAIVLVLAAYLINIVLILQHVSFTVGTVIIGIRAIAAATEPLAPVIRDIRNDVASIDEDLEALATGGKGRERRPTHSLGLGYRLMPGTRGW